MKSYINTFIILSAVLLTAFSGLMAQTENSIAEIKGKPYHEDLECIDCHTEAEPVTFPADFVCLDCHETDALVQATTRPEEDKWQNPHNNLHYGKDVPCMECHGEHQHRKHLCDGCHHFKYPNFKP